MNLPVVEYSIIYNKKDISKDISGQILNIQYTDKIAGESDELEISLEDTDGKWQNDWYPEKGDTIELIIRQAANQLNCGTFEVDELSCNDSVNGDIFTIKGLAAGIKKKLRTKSSYAHEDKSLKEIANTVASQLGLTLLGGDIPAIYIHRAHQFRETPLEFLNRIGNDYGCFFSVRNDNLVFIYYSDIESRASSLILTKQDLITFDFRDTTHKTYKKSRVKHHNPKTNETIMYEEEDDDEEYSEDELEIRTRVETKAQGFTKAKYNLHRSNIHGTGGDITVPGNLLFITGNNLQLNGVGNFSGIYNIRESRHNINRGGGYQSSGTILRVNTIDKKYFKTK